LVTLIAFTRGEEYFDDNNQNGVWDPGERFIDQGEPFVDANDDGLWNPGETYFDANHNGMYDGPNGVYDSNTTIWTEFRILYTGRPVPDTSHIWLIPGSFGSCAGGTGVPVGATVWLDAHFADLNLNRPQSDNVSYSATLSSTTRGGASILSPMLDGYGFGMDRLLVSAVAGPTFEQACTPTTAICKWKVLFYDWGRGQVNPVQLNGATSSGTCVDTTLTVNATVLGVITSIQAPGAFE
jgi:hypothetical protein